MWDLPVQGAALKISLPDSTGKALGMKKTRFRGGRKMRVHRRRRAQQASLCLARNEGMDPSPYT